MHCFSHPQRTPRASSPNRRHPGAFLDRRVLVVAPVHLTVPQRFKTALLEQSALLDISTRSFSNVSSISSPSTSNGTWGEAKGLGACEREPSVDLDLREHPGQTCASKASRTRCTPCPSSSCKAVSHSLSSGDTRIHSNPFSMHHETASSSHGGTDSPLCMDCMTTKAMAGFEKCSLLESNHCLTLRNVF